MSEKGNFGRRTWDREEYAKQARLRRENRDKPSETVLKQPTTRDSLDFNKDLNKRQVITGNVVSTRGRSFGFYCEVCDLTFKDNLKYVDHLNSKPHLIKAGELNQERQVTLEEVKLHYEELVKKIDDSMKNGDDKYDIKQRIERRKRFEEERKSHKKVKKELKETSIKDDQNDKDDDPMKKILGFSGFGSSKR